MTARPGVVYLLHSGRPYRHAAHYVGTENPGSLAARLSRHQAGGGARLIAVITGAGIGFTLARTTTGDRSAERAIKNAGGARRYCPLCYPAPRNAGGPRPGPLTR